MANVAVVVNHWGGIPVALQGNVVASQTWANARGVAHALELPNLDPKLAFRSIAAMSEEGFDVVCLDAECPAPLPLFDALHRAGVQIVVLGATGLRGRGAQEAATTRHDTSLPDPREDLHAWGVDRCSVHDAASSHGAAALHDEEVLLEARRLLAEGIQEPTLLWVNLLSCRDVDRCRFRPCTGIAALPSYVAPALPSTDDRLLPRNLQTPLEGLSHIAACADADTFGETAPSAANYFLEPGHYLRLLEESRETLLRLDAWTKMLIEDAEEAGAAIAMTATHSVALGEHGARWAGLPTDTCARTFWCATVARSEATARSLSTVVDDFLHQVFAVGPARARRPSCTLGTIAHGPVCVVVARATYRWNDRRYACIAKWIPEEGATKCPLLPLPLTHVFDLDMDPDESENILPQLAHIYTQLLEYMEACIPNSVVTPRPRRAPRAPASARRIPPSPTPLSAPSAAPLAIPLASPLVAPLAPTPLAPTPLPTSPSSSSVPATSELPTPLSLLTNSNAAAHLHRTPRRRPTIPSSSGVVPSERVAGPGPGPGPSSHSHPPPSLPPPAPLAQAPSARPTPPSGYIRRKESTLHNRHR